MYIKHSTYSFMLAYCAIINLISQDWGNGHNFIFPFSKAFVLIFALDLYPCLYIVLVPSFGNECLYSKVRVSTAPDIELNPHQVGSGVCVCVSVNLCQCYQHPQNASGNHGGAVNFQATYQFRDLSLKGSFFWCLVYPVPTVAKKDSDFEGAFPELYSHDSLLPKSKGNSLGTLDHYNVSICWPAATRQQTWVEMYFSFSLTQPTAP